MTTAGAFLFISTQCLLCKVVYKQKCGNPRAPGRGPAAFARRRAASSGCAGRGRRCDRLERRVAPARRPVPGTGFRPLSRARAPRLRLDFGRIGRGLRPWPWAQGQLGHAMPVRDCRGAQRGRHVGEADAIDDTSGAGTSQRPSPAALRPAGRPAVHPPCTGTSPRPSPAAMRGARGRPLRRRRRPRCHFWQWRRRGSGPGHKAAPQARPSGSQAPPVHLNVVPEGPAALCGKVRPSGGRCGAARRGAACRRRTAVATMWLHLAVCRDAGWYGRCGGRAGPSLRGLAPWRCQ